MHNDFHYNQLVKINNFNKNRTSRETLKIKAERLIGKTN